MTEQLDQNAHTANSKTEIYLKDYKPAPYQIDEVSLLFELSGDDALVTALSHFTRSDAASTEPLCLDGGPFMELVSIEIDGIPLKPDDYVKNETSLIIHDTAADFTLKIVTKLKPAENTRLEGLYKSSGNFCTQCEAEGFRHITYFLDRPDVMAKYKVRIEASKADYPVLLSNGNLIKKGQMPNGFHFAEWDDPFPKPSYLFAMVAGKLACLSDEFTTMSGRSVELNIYAAEEDISKCDHAMQSLKNSMRWDEETYGLEYDLDIYNIVAVADFNMGAMENKGLNIFNTKYVLASPETATDQDYNNIEGVIGHEYFHNWTGNRVTCREWFQLSLKEGLTVFRDQEFSSDMQSRAVKRLDDVRVLRMHQFPEDAGPLAHPVRPEKYIEINNFYSATVYNKGAEVIRMMHSLLGAEAFRRGMDIYFERHDGQAVTCEDFVCAMEAASDIDLRQFRRWYSTAGTPKLSFTRECDGDDVLLTVEQSISINGAEIEYDPLHVPIKIAWVDKARSVNGESSENNAPPTLLHLTDAKQTFRFEGVGKNVVPSIMREFSAPVHIDHDLDTEELLTLASFDIDPFVRSDALQTIGRNIILTAAQKLESNEEFHAPESYYSTFERLISDDDTDPAFLAELLTLPGEIDVGQHMQPLRPQTLHKAREFVADQIANRYFEPILDKYNELQAFDECNRPKQQGVRRYKNTLLGYLARTSVGEDILSKQFDNSQNMTDEIAALGLLSSSDFDYRNTALAQFFERWKHEALVIDKWFAVQAVSKRSDVLSTVRSLLKHQHFSFVNPNRLRALVSSFSVLNQAGFHDESGAGYEFLADVVLKVDRINPQTAARLVAPLGQWKRLDHARQLKIQSLLDDLLKKHSLSDDVRELLEKSLN
ncbi:aminopeptidase N [Kordiimonas sp. SCSIO 12610]|uniref:aminopeptidase N n=1 Tax=Kordiimonas sp. SCSIO 12610 TaxID=2829597 RepID=UPI002108AF4E|nr:aminopeptidase N [Kordiimonas sp. SCSIO 12610]UTW54166.1 aminopeptidase N [Kordiimonas sp. SCSIO 12610]